MSNSFYGSGSIQLLVAWTLVVGSAHASLGGRDEELGKGVGVSVHLGTWRAWLQSPGGELPFGLEIDRRDERLHAVVINGTERIPIPEVVQTAGSLLLEITHYDSRIRCAPSPDGRRLDGLWRKRVGQDRWAELGFHATAGAAPRFPADPVTYGNVTASSLDGRWRVQFESSEDPAVAILQTTEDGITMGTFLTTTGDYRYLAGTFSGSRLRLSCFDGAHAFLFDASLRDGQTLHGDFWSRDSWHETWTATRDPEAALPDAFARTVWDTRTDLEALAYPDLDGTVRTLADPRFKGKARLIYVFGSWCPNCHDATAYLARLYERYRERGLSIVGLAFELTDDFERNAEQLRIYARKHEIDWPLLLAGPADKKKATEAFPALDRVRSYPTTIFLDATGEVRAVHTGFAGPATGAAHDELRTRFESTIENLLNGAP